MMTLAVDGSASMRTIALLDGQALLAETSLSGGRATPWFQAIDKILREAGVDRAAIRRLAVGLGPGSYTGIRSTLALAEGWRLACGTEVIGIGAVEACARVAQRRGWLGRHAIVIDAQRGEFYLAEVDISPDAITPAVALHIASRNAVDEASARGARRIGPDLAALGLEGECVLPEARAIGELAGLQPAPHSEAATLEPIYLRATTFVKAPPARTIA